MSQPGQVQYGQAQSGFGVLAPKGTYGDFTISQKKNEQLRKFSGITAEYEIWANRLVDHMCEGNPKWKQLLD